MRDEDKAKEQLVDELVELRQRVAELEASEAERATKLRKSEERLRVQYKSTPIPTYTWQRIGEDFVLVDYNAAAAAITQGNVAKFLGAKFSEMYRDRPEIREELSRCFAEKTSIEREMFYRFKVTGESKHLAVKYVFAPPDLVLVHTEDITERKHTEEALWESEKKLRDVTERWTVEKRLMRSEKLTLLGRLSANLVNKLNNPIDGAFRYVRLLLDQMPEDDPRRIHAERARDGLMRMANFARKSIPVFRPIDIPQSIRRLLSSFSDQISAQNIKIEAEFDKNLPIIMNADVEQIFMNIMKNAIQAMPNGGTLSVKTKRLSPRLFEARFSDTGSGIPDEILENIFDPFFTTKDIGQGVGLGLSISQEIAESYGGSIDVESKSHKGTTFIVRLPISESSTVKSFTAEARRSQG